MNRSETCFAWSSFLTKAFTIISWLKGLWHSLNVASTYKHLVQQGTRAVDQWRKQDVSYYGPSGQHAGTLMGCGQLPVQTPSSEGHWVSVSDGDS